MSFLKYAFALIITALPSMNCQATVQLKKTYSRFGTVLKSHPRLAYGAAIGLVGAGVYYGLKRYLQAQPEQLRVQGTILSMGYSSSDLQKLQDAVMYDFRLEITLEPQFNKPIKDFLDLQKDTSAFKGFKTQLWITGQGTGDKIKRLGENFTSGGLHEIILRKATNPDILFPPFKFTLLQTGNLMQNNTEVSCFYHSFATSEAASIPYLAVFLQDGKKSIDLTDENTYFPQL